MPCLPLVFTTGIVSTGAGWKAALYASGSKHAGENLAEILIVNLRAGRRKTVYIGVKNKLRMRNF